MNINENIENEKVTIKTQWGAITKQVTKRATIARLRAINKSLTSKCFEKNSSRRAFFFSRPSNSNVRSLNMPKIKPIQAFTLVLVTNSYDDTIHQPNMNKLEWRHNFPIIRLWIFVRHSSKRSDLTESESHPRCLSISL